MHMMHASMPHKARCTHQCVVIPKRRNTDRRTLETPVNKWCRQMKIALSVRLHTMGMRFKALHHMYIMHTGMQHKAK